MRLGEVSAVVPFRYSRLVFGVAIGVWFFDENLEFSTLLGSAIVVISGLYALWPASGEECVFVARANVGAQGYGGVVYTVDRGVLAQSADR